jgi:hypothetical protein
VTTTRPLSNLALAMMALPVILGAWLCYVRPERAWVWVFGMFFLPVLWLAIKATGQAFGKTTVAAMTMCGENIPESRKTLSGAMIFASLLIAVALGARLADALGLMEGTWAQAIINRATNVFVGGYLVFHGNRLPKILTPVWSARCDSATMQTLRRRTGWAYVLAGLAFTLLWLALPVHLARPIGMAVIVAGVLVPSVIMLVSVNRRAKPLER